MCDPRPGDALLEQCDAGMHRRILACTTRKPFHGARGCTWHDLLIAAVRRRSAAGSTRGIVPKQRKNSRSSFRRPHLVSPVVPRTRSPIDPSVSPSISSSHPFQFLPFLLLSPRSPPFRPAEVHFAPRSDGRGRRGELPRTLRTVSVAMADLEECKSLLKCALGMGGDATGQRDAEMRLAASESEPGFCLAMAQIVEARASESKDVRWLASTCLKNAVSKHWRTPRPNQGPTPEEKQRLRTWLLQAYDEEEASIATQINVAMAKVARSDFPRDWNDIFPALIEGMHAAEERKVLRAHLALHWVLKELSSKRLASDQKNFEAVASQLFDFVWKRWEEDTGAILSWIPHGLSELRAQGRADPAVQACIERWRLCIKVIQRLVVYGFESDARALKLVPVISKVVPAFMETFQRLMPHWELLQDDDNLTVRQLRRGALKLFRSQEEFQQTHPWSYMEGGIAVQVLEFCHEIITAPEVTRLEELYEPIVIESMILTQAILMCSIYQGNYTVLGMHERSPEKEALVERLSAQSKDSLDGFLSRERVVKITQTLVDQYFPLTERELRAWNEDPESFQIEQTLIQFRDGVRQTAESLFVFLLGSKQDLLAPLIIQWLHSAIATCPTPQNEAEDTGFTQALLRKEAVYNAASVGSHSLYHLLAFGEWLQSSLLPEMLDRRHSARVLRRRCAYVLGAWVAEIPQEARPGCYNALISLLSSDDMCLQLTALSTFKTLIDDWNFYEDQFLEFCWPVLRCLFSMAHTASEFDTQLQVFSLISLIVERLAEKIQPYAGAILETLPDVWQHGESQTMLRMQVVIVLQKLVVSLDTHSPSAYGIILPILHYATSPDHHEATALLEDGMLLWRTVLKYSRSLPPELLRMFPNLVKVLELGFEHLQVGVQILESYLLVEGSSFFDVYGQQACALFVGIFGEVKEKGMLLTIPVLDTYLCCLPIEGPRVLEPALQKLLYVAMFGNESDLVVGASCGIFGRLLLQSQNLFLQFFERAFSAGVARSCSTIADARGLFLYFVDVWLDKVDCVTTEPRRKLAALSLSQLLSLNQPELLSRLELIISACTSVIHEYESDGSIPSAIEGGPHRPSPTFDLDADAPGSTPGEVQRKIALYEADPVNALSVRVALASQLQACVQMYGEAYHHHLQQVDPAVWAQYQRVAAGR